MVVPEIKSIEEIMAYREGPVVALFHAVWCSPCRQMGPEFDDVASSYQNDPRKIMFRRVDIDSYQVFAQENQVRGVPNLFIFRDGKRVDSQAGGMDKENIKKTIEEALEKA